MHNNLLAVPLIERTARGGPLFFAGDLTDRGSPLEQAATEAGYRKVFRADPNVGGRYSALTAFGLVPTALAGADVAELLDQAEEFATSVTSESDNPTGDSGSPSRR
jgi:hypothetical protein